MGLTIHYKGNFNKNASLPALIEEVRDIAEIYKWKYIEFEGEFPPGSLDNEAYNEDIYGISFVVPGCEPVYLTFLSNGRMSNDMNLKFYGGDKTKSDYLYQLFTKTQYGGIQAHVTIIQILRHLSNKYLSHFELYDEGGYWETNDIKVLTETFTRYTEAINVFAEALENNKPAKGENLENFFGRVLKQIQTGKKKKPGNGK